MHHAGSIVGELLKIEDPAETSDLLSRICQEILAGDHAASERN